MTTQQILPYTSEAEIFGKGADILGSAFITAVNKGTPEEMQERVMVPLSQQAIEKGGDVLLCVRETPIPNSDKSIFIASIGRRFDTI